MRLGKDSIKVKMCFLILPLHPSIVSFSFNVFSHQTSCIRAIYISFYDILDRSQSSHWRFCSMWKKRKKITDVRCASVRDDKFDGRK